MKISNEQLKQIIKEELETVMDEGMQTLATAPLSQPDPNDHLFKIMDQVTDLALEKIGKRQDQEAEAEISPLSNEVVTSMVNIEAMADEVLSRYNEGYKGESYE
jgi:hypothetical protein